MFSTTSVRNISHSKSEILSGMNIGLREVFLAYFNDTWNFLDILPKNKQISNFMKIRPVTAEFYVVGQTDMSELIVTFRNFVNRHR
jgi:hypothetical protein